VRSPADDGAERAVLVRPTVKGHNVDLAKTFTTEFALQANKNGS
jgi:hypothetical protein